MKRYFFFSSLIFLLAHLPVSLAGGSSLISLVSAQSAPVNHNVSVSALVPPQVPDFQFIFLRDSQNEPTQGRTLLYEITYGANSSAGVTTTNTIVVNFSDDKAPDKTHVLDYVIGSASNGYNQAQPIVDLINRTITWIIPDLPAGTTDQKLYFQLNTNWNYSGSYPVNFRTTANMRNEYVTLPEQSHIQTYKFNPALITPGPTQTPTPVPPTPIPTPVPNTLRITHAEITAISDKAALLNITTNRPTKLRIKYGTSPKVKSFTQTAQTNQFATNSDVSLTNLQPATQYYFQILATDAGGVMRWSEVFTFITAKEPPPQLPGNSSVVITSGNAIILSDVLSGGAVRFGILPTQTDYKLIYSLGSNTPFTPQEVVVKGVNDTDRIVSLTQEQPGVFVASLRTGEAGLYDLFIRATDQKGNLTTQKVARLKIAPPLSVFETGTNLPLGDARIYLSRFNEQTQQFEEIKSLQNPRFTNQYGEDSFILPPGMYKVAVSALGHTGKTVTFTLGPKPGDEYPSIYLDADPFNFLSFLRYLKTMLIDNFELIMAWLQSLSHSVRLFNSIAAATLGGLVLLTFLLFTFRTDIRWRDLTPYFVFHLLVFARKHHQAYLYGLVSDANGKPVVGARIEVVDPKTDTVLAHTISNKSGRFVLTNTFKPQYIKLLVSKDGFPEQEALIAIETKGLIKIQMLHHEEQPLRAGVRHMLGEFFELLLLLALIAELGFLFTFGTARTIPFFLLSLFNLILWFFFQREKKL